MGPLELDHALNVYPDMPSYFQAWEGGALLGSLSVFTPLPHEAELGAFVQPPHRRRGIFTALVREAAGLLAARGFSSLLFPCDWKSEAGAAVARRWGMELDHSEYLMFHQGPRPAPPQGLTMREAAEGDLDLLTGLYVSAFGDDPADSEAMERKSIRDPGLLSAVFFHEDAFVGAAHVNLQAETLSIYGVAVCPQLQGRGWGRALLAALLAALPQDRKVSLEVDSGNARALGLYQTSGFVTSHRDDYYRLPLAKIP